MKYTQLFFAAIFSLFFHVPWEASVAQSKENLFKGTWLRLEASEKLIKTRSPKQAFRNTEILLLRIDADSAGLYWTVIYNFHEGVTARLNAIQPTKNKQTYLVDVKPGNPYEADVSYFETPDRGKTRLKWIREAKGSKTAMNFARIDDNFFNRVTLAGEYQDRDGSPVQISENGELKSSQYNFKFDVGLDYVFAECDYIEVPGKTDEYNWPLRYGFRTKDRSLEFFKLKSDGEILQASSEVILKLVRKK